MTIFDEPTIGEVPADLRDGYWQFPAALGKTEFDTRVTRVHTLPEAVNAVQRGIMPDNAGLFTLNTPDQDKAEYPIDEVGAIDLVAFRSGTNSACFLPTSKGIVDDQTHEFKGAGVVTLTYPGADRVRIFALTLDQSLTRWRRRANNARTVGNASLKLLGADVLDYDVVDTDPLGLVFARPRRPIMSVPRNILSK